MGRVKMRTVAGSVVSAVLALGLTAPATVQQVRADSSVTIHALSPDGTGCGHAISPLSINAEDVVADGSRPWADIKDFTVTQVSSYSAPSNSRPAGAATDGALEVTIDLCGAIPSAFPTANGDVGVAWMLFVRNLSSYAGSPASPQRIGTGAHGEPVYDGPFPASQGYQYFGFVALQGGAGVAPVLEFGQGWFDPTQQFTYLGNEAGTHTANGGNADPTHINATPGATSVSLVIPQSWWWQNGGLWSHETIWSGGDNLDLSHSVGMTQATTRSTGLIDLVASPVSWAPGYQLCDPLLPGEPIANPATCVTSSPNAYDLGTVGQSYPVAALPTPPAVSQTGTVTYAPCQPAATWPSGIPGQGPGQDEGALHAVDPAACSGATSSLTVPYPYQYSSIYGRVLLPGAAHFTSFPGLLG